MVPRNLYGSKCWLYDFNNIVFNSSEADKKPENTIDINLTFHSRNKTLSKKRCSKHRDLIEGITSPKWFPEKTVSSIAKFLLF